MISNTNSEKLILDTKKYEFADGLRDIQLGIYFIIFGPSLAVVYTPFWWKSIIYLKEISGSFGIWAIVIFWISLPLLGFIFSQLLINYIRKRWLWKDSGEVKAKRNMIPWTVTLIGVIGFVIVLLTGFYLSSSLKSGEFYIFSLIMTGVGISNGLILIGMSRHFQITRYFWMGILGLFASSLILIEQEILYLPPLFLGLGWGLIFIVSGGLALRNLLLGQGE